MTPLWWQKSSAATLAYPLPLTTRPEGSLPFPLMAVEASKPTLHGPVQFQTHVWAGSVSGGTSNSQGLRVLSPHGRILSVTQSCPVHGRILLGTQLCPALCNPIHGSPFPSPGDLTTQGSSWVSCVVGGFFPVWATREVSTEGACERIVSAARHLHLCSRVFGRTFLIKGRVKSISCCAKGARGQTAALAKEHGKSRNEIWGSNGVFWIWKKGLNLIIVTTFWGGVQVLLFIWPALTITKSDTNPVYKEDMNPIEASVWRGRGTSGPLEVQGLGISALTVGTLGSILAQGTKIMQGPWHIGRKERNGRKFKVYYFWNITPGENRGLSSVQFSSVAQSCLTLCDPMNRSTPGLHHQLPEFTQTHVHGVSDAIQPSHPLTSPSPPAPNPSQHQSLFQWVNSSHEVAKVLEFQL